MKALYDVPAPAKLNLFLHIIGRRPDGYHLLQSVFMLVDWCDTLHFELRASGQISREDSGISLPEDDLIVRAARSLQQAVDCPAGVHIRLEKRIPVQAGMGGGSSDAASCLLALNRLWGLRLPLGPLEKIGLALGSDVPFFLRGRNAWVEGIGDQIHPVEVPCARFAVVKPHEGLDTASIFRDAALKRDSAPAIISGFAANHEGLFPFGFGHNDLQPVAQRLCPTVTQALEWLGGQGMQARMTGSGSAVFAQMPHEKSLLPAPAGWQVRECGNLAVHPLVGWAASDDFGGRPVS
ncbi:MAG: 4-(cytidine 5'-diphospho)-2-C-methyl-D-erythritol kinase [Ramlibacter sp.]|nr:4-(cytidine 5'-diphospho)-2-C-methyl-D-erythritol kinase [Ramlibacter sp.]